MSTEITREQYIADSEEDERTLPSALDRLTLALEAYARRKYGKVDPDYMLGLLRALLAYGEPATCERIIARLVPR